MKNTKKYHGFLGLPRHSKLLFYDLGYMLYGFYIGLVMEAVWFRGNPDFCCINKTQKELAISLNCNQSTVSRILAELQARKYLINHEVYKRLAYFPLFLTDVASKMHSKDYANLNELYADMHRINAEMQDKYALSQGKRDQNATQSLYSSSNDNLSFSQEEINLDEIAAGIEKQKEEKGSSL